MHIGQVLDAVYDNEVGWRPASGSIKPTHVANGLVRALLGRYYDTTRLNSLVIWAKYGVALEDRGYRALVEDAPEGDFAAFVGRRNDFDRLRRYAQGLLNADRAVYPAADKSSFTLTAPQMVTRDNNDRGLGAFASALVGGGKGTLGDLVAEHLGTKRPSDPITTLVWPLLDQEARETSAPERLDKALRRTHNQRAIALLREAANALSSHERVHGNRLRTLQRATHFACIATHAHAQALGANGDMDKRVPALIALGHRHSAAARASEQSLDLLYESFEEWLGDGIAARLQKKQTLTEEEGKLELSDDGRVVRRVLGELGSAEKPHGAPDVETLSARMEDYRQAKHQFGADGGARVLGQALVAMYRREYASGGPRKFLQGLACKAGFLYPHFQGATRDKRVRPSVPILDLLVRCCVESGVVIPLDDFLDRLWDRLGLVVGGRCSEDRNDERLLNERGIVVDGQALAENTELFVEQLVGIGLAKRYADNVTFVGDGHVN